MFRYVLVVLIGACCSAAYGQSASDVYRGIQRTFSQSGRSSAREEREKAWKTAVRIEPSTGYVAVKKTGESFQGDFQLGIEALLLLVKVVSVAGDDSFLGEYTSGEASGHEKKTTLWFKGFSTKGVVDNQYAHIFFAVHVTGTKTYETVAGGNRTITLIEPYTVKEAEEREARELEVARARAAAEKSKKKAEEERRKAEQERTKVEQERKAAIENAKYRTWTADGTNIEAKYSWTINGTVTLTKRDGHKVKVLLDDLSDEERAWIENRKVAEEGGRPPVAPSRDESKQAQTPVPGQDKMAAKAETPVRETVPADSAAKDDRARSVPTRVSIQVDAYQTAFCRDLYNAAKQARLQNKNEVWSVTDKPLATESLKDTNILVVGHCFKPKTFSAGECDAVVQFVREGGSLLIAGLTWSGLSYGKYAADAEYPPNQIGTKFGLLMTGSYAERPAKFATHPITNGLAGLNWSKGDGIPSAIKVSDGAMPLVYDSKQHVLCAVREYGKGRVCMMGWHHAMWGCNSNNQPNPECERFLQQILQWLADAQSAELPAAQ